MNKRMRKKKGLSKITNEEVWNLNFSLGKHILPRLIKFKELNVNSHPCDFESIEAWHVAVDKMIWTFDMQLNDRWNVPYDEVEVKRFKEGMALFGEYFWDLWD